jgi:16S rRNA pseudouridine516 synthase
MRLDRFLTRRTGLSGREISRRIADGDLLVDGTVALSGLCEIGPFTRVEMNGEALQAREVVYLMLHKPAGYLSATADPQHPTVIELIDHPLRSELHLAGRLDRASTGLVLLTNDGRWSKRVTEPLEEISKIYRVTTRDPIREETAGIFAAGLYFAYEDLTTRPAVLEKITDHEALIHLNEGRYHQVKRMFHAVGNQVLSLHREQIGPLVLEDSLPAGGWRSLTQSEIAYFQR